MALIALSSFGKPEHRGGHLELDLVTNCWPKENVYNFIYCSSLHLVNFCELVGWPVTCDLTSGNSRGLNFLEWLGVWNGLEQVPCS